MLAMILLLAAPLPAEVSYRWVPYNDGTGDYMLMQGECHVGQWSAQRGEFYPRNPSTRVWGLSCQPPVAPPCLNFGLIETPRPQRERFSTPAGEIPQAEAMDLVRNDAAPDLPNDKDRRRVLVIGTPEQTAAVETAWRSDGALSAWRDAVTFQVIPPGDWRLEGCGFQTQGCPVIYYLDKDGTVIHRQDDFDGGATALAEALRDADQTYDRRLDPDRRSPWFRLLSGVKQIPDVVFLGVIVAVAVLVLLLLRKG